MRSTGMALMKMTGIMGVNSFSRASVITPEWMSHRAPAILQNCQGTSYPVAFALGGGCFITTDGWGGVALAAQLRDGVWRLGSHGLVVVRANMLSSHCDSWMHFALLCVGCLNKFCPHSSLQHGFAWRLHSWRWELRSLSCMGCALVDVDPLAAPLILPSHSPLVFSSNCFRFRVSWFVLFRHQIRA